MKLHLGVMSTLPDHSATLHIRSILCRFHNFKKLKNVKIKPTILVVSLSDVILCKYFLLSLLTLYVKPYRPIWNTGHRNTRNVKRNCKCIKMHNKVRYFPFFFHIFHNPFETHVRPLLTLSLTGDTLCDSVN